MKKLSYLFAFVLALLFVSNTASAQTNAAGNFFFAKVPSTTTLPGASFGTSAHTPSRMLSAVMDAVRARAKEQHPRCARCGQPIADPAQHCPATDHTVPCCVKIAEANTQGQDFPVHCAQCHKELTVDERFHGAEHQCQEAITCVHCGQHFTPGTATHCPALGSTGLCEVSKPEPTNDEPTQNTVCPECGVPYSMDEMYHGATHECSPERAEAFRQEMNGQDCCVYCGHEVRSEGQLCTAPDNLKQPCTKVCPKCGKELPEIEGVHECLDK